MNVGILGLGRMGMGMGVRLARRGHTVAGFDLVPTKRTEAAEAGIIAIEKPPDIGNALAAPRVIIISVPAGGPVDDAISDVLPGLASGDILVDAGNSFFKDSIRRASELGKSGIEFLDAGISGGVWGLENGYCLMVGGKREAYDKAEPVFADLAQEGGYRYVGPSGAGHFAKMVHNGIEYGLLQAYGEGFEILKASQYDYDLHEIASLWNRGSVVRSWLLELAELAFAESPDLADISGWVEDSGEGRWTVIESLEERVPAPVIALSLMMRFRSRQDDSFSAKVIAALRKEFGGHAVKEK